MNAVRDLFETNLGDPLDAKKDIPLSTVIHNGNMLTAQEKLAVDTAIEQLVAVVDTLPEGTVQGVVFDAYLGQIGYFSDSGFTPVVIDNELLAQVQNILFRESTTAQYITNAMASIPNLKVNVFTKPEEDTPVAEQAPVLDSIVAAVLAEHSI